MSTSTTGTIAASQISPRFDDQRDVLYWFAGDTFDIEWNLMLLDADTSEAHPYEPGDMLYITFFDAKKNMIQQFKFTDVQNNTVVTHFTPAISKKFPPAVYTYCIKYQWDDDGETRVQTLIDNKKVKVEACH